MRTTLGVGCWLLILVLVAVQAPGGPATQPPAASQPDDKKHIVDLDGVKIEFVRVGKGKFWMGSPEEESGRDGDEKQKQVTIAEEFHIGKFEVTQAQWEAVMGKGKNPSYFSRTGTGKGQVKDFTDADLRQFPVESVSWNDVQDFLKKLNDRTTGRNTGWTYRLPREAEWEYACRGGPAAAEEGKKTAPFYFDKPTFSLSSKQANFDGNYPYGGAAKGPDLERPVKVGSFKPNPLGIHDMHGNTWEWCDDPFVGYAGRVIRGGGWDNLSRYCRAGLRLWQGAGSGTNYLGFRVARVVESK